MVEWFDRWQSSGLAITYPVFKREDVNQFGVWRVYLKPVECPVVVGGNRYNFTFQFMDNSKPYPLNYQNQTAWTESGPSVGDLPDGVAETLCNNLADEPCGLLTEADPNRNPIGHIKMKISQSRVPVGDVVLMYNGGACDEQNRGWVLEPQIFCTKSAAGPAKHCTSTVLGWTSGHICYDNYNTWRLPVQVSRSRVQALPVECTMSPSMDGCPETSRSETLNQDTEQDLLLTCRLFFF